MPMVTRPDHLGDEAAERVPRTAETGQTESLGEPGISRRTWMKTALAGVAAFAALGLDACGDAGSDKAKAGDLALYNGIVHPMAGTTGIDFSTKFKEPVTIRITVLSPDGRRLHEADHSVKAGDDSVSMPFIPEAPLGSKIVISKPGSRTLEFEVLDSGMPAFPEGS